MEYSKLAGGDPGVWGKVTLVPAEADASSTESLSQVKKHIEISKVIPLLKPSLTGCSKGLE